jgi:GST-like protein
MIVTPTNKSVTKLEGLHLYHADMSNCSMRVRMTLEEKSLPWTSHHLDLRKKEAVTPEYFGIHPKGLVPTLVHDGVVHIESNEIIEYLDETFPDPPLQPQVEEERQEMRDWLRTATEIHVPAVKTLIYTRKIAKVLRKNQVEDAQYRALQNSSPSTPPPQAEMACPRRMSTRRRRRCCAFSTKSRRNYLSTNGSSATSSRWPIFPGRRCTSR